MKQEPTLSPIAAKTIPPFLAVLNLAGKPTVESCVPPAWL